MKGSILHIGNVIILIIFIFLFYSCEKELTDDVYAIESKIWVNAVIGTNDTVRIYLGTTSGLNSGDIAQYRDDATINLYVNSGLSKELEYKVDAESPAKGYYYYPRLSEVKSGDSLRFEASINDAGFDDVVAETYIPFAVEIDTLIYTSKFDAFSNKLVIDVSIKLDSLSKNNEEKYFELKLKNKIYSDYNLDYPTEIEDISNFNNLSFSYGQSWNDGLQSILVDYSKVEGNDLEVSFSINDYSIENIIEAELKTITKDYYIYHKALDNGGVTKSNILNGSGIFAGYSNSVKSQKVK